LFGDNGLRTDLDQIDTVIRAAEVFEIDFPFFAERLLVDSRRNLTEKPLIRVLEPLRSSADRMGWLARRRPSLGPPHAISFIFWPSSIGQLGQSTTWQAIRAQLLADSDEELSTKCEVALSRLISLETETAMDLLRGENCYTLWPNQVQEGRR
jgi:hypothetical protein